MKIRFKRDYPISTDKVIPQGYEAEATDGTRFFMIEFEGKKMAIVKSYVEPAEGLEWPSYEN